MGRAFIRRRTKKDRDRDVGIFHRGQSREVLLVSRSAARLYWGTDDPVTLVVVATTLAVVALLSSLVPAWQALRLDPVKVLRAE